MCTESLTEKVKFNKRMQQKTEKMSVLGVMLENGGETKSLIIASIIVRRFRVTE